jgi:hypothetical protein
MQDLKKKHGSRVRVDSSSGTRVLSIHQLQRMPIVSAAVRYEAWMAIARSNANPQIICESGLVLTN